MVIDNDAGKPFAGIREMLRAMQAISTQLQITAGICRLQAGKRSQ